MADKSMTTGAMGYGEFRVGVGLLFILLGIAGGVILGVKVHGAHMTDAYGNQRPGGGLHGPGYVGAMGIGLGGAVTGMFLVWGGMVLRTLALIANRVEASRTAVSYRSAEPRVQREPEPVPEMAFRRFALPTTNG